MWWHTHKTRFHLLAKRASPFKSAGVSVQSTTGSRGVRISVSNAGYTMFRGSVKSIGYPLHLPVSPSLPLPCVTMCHHISTGLYFQRPDSVLIGRTNWFLPYLTGSFPKFMFDERLHVVIVALIQCSKITESTAKWSESRRDALKALTSVCHTVFSEKDMQTGKFQLSQLCCHFRLCKLGGRGGILHHTLYISCKV